MTHFTPSGVAFEHFVGNLPYYPKATNSFQQGLYKHDQEEALRCAYIQSDRPYQAAWLKFDLDDVEAGARWIDHGLPRPHFIVGNPRNGHGHYLGSRHGLALAVR